MVCPLCPVTIVCTSKQLRNTCTCFLIGTEYMCLCINVAYIHIHAIHTLYVCTHRLHVITFYMYTYRPYMCVFIFTPDSV